MSLCRSSRGLSKFIKGQVRKTSLLKASLRRIPPGTLPSLQIDQTSVVSTIKTTFSLRGHLRMATTMQLSKNREKVPFSALQAMASNNTALQS